MGKQLELTKDMIERNDNIDNTVFECIKTLTQKELEWDMEIIGEVTDAIKQVLASFHLDVYHPGIATDKEGNQIYAND